MLNSLLPIRFTRGNLVFLAIAGVFVGFVGCNGLGTAPDNLQQGVATPTGSVPVGRVSLTVTSPSGAVVYSDSNASTALALTAGTQYDFNLAGNQVPAGTVFTMVATNIDLPTAAPSSVTLSLGDNAFTPPTPGDYLMSVTANGAAAAEVAPASYQASVICANPNFTAASLNPAGITVSAGSGSNLYTFSAAGVTSSANGTAPYLCAWDVDGDGIQDTAFTDCGTAASDEYVNYVGTRNIGLIVKDTCNIPQTVSAPENLAYTVPAKPGNVFIYGQLASGTGTAATDSRINGVNYLATNSGGHNIVQPSYSAGASGKGSFTITSPFNYGLPSSLGFGMQLNVTGLSDTISVSAGTGTVDASQAVLSKTVYTTDQAGDQSPARSLTGTTCQLTNPGAQVIFQQGTPCSAGTTGDQNSANVEVWGDYVCVVSDAGGSTTITGQFDGIAHLADNCVGGGGGGGGGINPIGL